MSIRKMLEEREEKFLSPYAQLSSQSRGRAIPEEECSIRPAFQHDRDRILHSKSFRRLKHKTQVFLTPGGDHYRTRLTHTLEVAQIARTMAKALCLNEDLTEAIALGHDLGHTPFGHAGEEVLNEICPGGFRHSAQSLRVVDFLERDGRGLNLTLEVRDGILKHSKGKGDVIPEDSKDVPLTHEGRIVRIADIIAYINHDLDDAVRAGLISPQDIPQDCTEELGDSHGKRIDSMVRDILEQAQETEPLKIGLSGRKLEATIKLRDFLYDRVYDLPAVHGDFIKSAKVLRELYGYFLENQKEFRRETGEAFAHEPIERSIADFIAGMTDRYAFKLYEKIFLPQPWLII
jgi:dGTPase